ncbi:MAG: hypothetical protein M3O35_19885 [Acidobacteriota bacterium]|nr:hypothetical protein [Acidobacteriota bacterium]
MRIVVLKNPLRTNMFGFTCQSWISCALIRGLREMEGLRDADLAQVYYAWFARELNPLANGPSSNPLTLYEMLDSAVKKKDVNHPKVKDLRANLLRPVNRSITDRTVARQLKHQIRTAPIEMFHPQLWRIDLSKI